MVWITLKSSILLRVAPVGRGTGVRFIWVDAIRGEAQDCDGYKKKLVNVQGYHVDKEKNHREIGTNPEGHLVESDIICTVTVPNSNILAVQG